MEDRYRVKLWDSKNSRFVCLVDNTNVKISTKGLEVHDKKRFQIVQCTGLKDIEGTLIYDGDILEIDGIRAKVLWIDDGWKLLSNEDVFLGCGLFPQIRSVEGVDDGKAMWGRIVGNSFEHDEAELLGTGKIQEDEGIDTFLRTKSIEVNEVTKYISRILKHFPTLVSLGMSCEPDSEIADYEKIVFRIAVPEDAEYILKQEQEFERESRKIFSKITLTNFILLVYVEV